MECFSFKSGCVVQVARRLNEDLVHSVAVAIAIKNNFVVLLKSLIANVLK